jgi:hypothetical protein
VSVVLSLSIPDLFTSLKIPSARLQPTVREDRDNGTFFKTLIFCDFVQVGSCLLPLLLQHHSVKRHFGVVLVFDTMLLNLRVMYLNSSTSNLKINKQLINKQLKNIIPFYCRKEYRIF